MSTFGSFTTVRLGIYASQKGLDVTGNNITNINTNGYTRQRLDQVSLVTTAADRYYSPYKTRVGQGVLTTGVSQLRDPGLDISYRKAQADLGSADAKLAGLEDLAKILDEVGKGDGEQDDGVILNQMNDLRDLINGAITNGIEEYDPLIRESADALTALFRDYATQLEQMADKYETRLNDQVDTVNSILSGLQKLNVSIRNADIRGDEALELRDQRNLLLDELSQYMKIDVTYSMEDVGAGLKVEKLTVSLANEDKNTLVDGEYATQLSLFTPQLSNDPDKPYLDENGAPTASWDTAVAKDKNDGNYNTQYGIVLRPMTDTNGDRATPADVPAGAPTDVGGLALGDTALYGALQSTREMLTEKGEYSTANEVTTILGGDPDAAIKRGIPYYQYALDSLARTFAEAMNKINTDNGGGPLFSTSSNNDNVDNITAANISVSQSWAEGKTQIVAAAQGAPSGDTSVLAQFLNLFNREDIDFLPTGVVNGAVGSKYTGSFEDMLLRIQSTLAEDQKTTTTLLTNYTVTHDEVYTDRDSVMGVDLNDEATSLMTYQKAYTAACRLMTVLEQALDSLINGTIV